MKRTFADLIDLASERIGGQTLLASDDFFAPKENLLKAGRGVFKPDLYTDHGKWMDGWESRRKRTPGHDWCIIKLGLPGSILGANIDTNHFLGNHPPYASIEACAIDGEPTANDLSDSADWTTLIPKSALSAGSENLFEIETPGRWTHVRLNIFPDGGVARLRLHGIVEADVGNSGVIDLAAVENGGLPVDCSDMFFSNMQNLIMPEPSANMGDGWETRRKRDPGHDWMVLRLGQRGKIGKIIVDTSHFKGNYPDMCSIDACVSDQSGLEPFDSDSQSWEEILPPTKLDADKVHEFSHIQSRQQAYTHIRLNIFPDGGVARLRVMGEPE